MNDNNEDVSLSLDKIKIKNYSDWSQTSTADFTQNERFTIGKKANLQFEKQLSEGDTFELKIDVKVTFHKMHTF